MARKTDKEKNTFVSYKMWGDIYRAMPAEQVKQLVVAVYDYQDGIEPAIDDPVLIGVFNMMKTQMDKDREKYEKVCKERSQKAEEVWSRRKSIQNDTSVNTNSGSGADAQTSTNKDTHAYTSIHQHTKNTDIDNDIEFDIDNDIDSDIDINNSDKSELQYIPVNRDKVDCRKIADAFNEICISYPQVTRLTDKRKKAIRSRVKEYDEDTVLQVFRIAEDSDFLKGKNDRGWSATFDWIMNPNNFVKIYEGNYPNTRNSPKKEFKTSNPFLQMLAEEGALFDDENRDYEDFSNSQSGISAQL